MKRIMAVVLMVMVLVINVTTVQAAEKKINENRVKRLAAEYEMDLADAFSENEAKARAIEYSVSYKEIAKDIYDVSITFEVYKKYVYEYHKIYDSEDDYDLTEYGIKDGKRIELSDLNDYLEEKFPELK